MLYVGHYLRFTDYAVYLYTNMNSYTAGRLWKPNTKDRLGKSFDGILCLIWYPTAAPVLLKRGEFPSNKFAKILLLIQPVSRF